MLDLLPMKGVRVDPATRTAWARPGLPWGELDRATQTAGLATTGGIGWLMRKHGLTCDNLLEVELATAEGGCCGSTGTSSPSCCGACGAAAGTWRGHRLPFRLHPVGPQVLAGPVLYPAEQAGKVPCGWRDWAAGAADEVTTVVNLRLAPLRRLARPLADRVTVKPYTTHQATFDATVPHGLRH